MVTKKKFQAIVAEIRAFCSENGDESVIKKYSRYFTEGYDAYGLTREIYEAQRDKFVDTYKDSLGLDGFLKLGDILIKSGKYEEASFAISFITPYKSEFTDETFQYLGTWLENGICNWGHTDVFCGLLLAEFFENNVVKLEALSTWRNSPSKWKRRAVPVSMITLLKKSRSFKKMIDFIDPMMMDDQRFVQQGLGWFLREMWKKQPEPVETHLLKWKNLAPRKIFQYATEKMSPEEKARFRKDKKNK